MKIYRGSGFIVLVALLICSGCGGRDTSTLSRALIGHWRYENSEYDFVFEFYLRPDGTVIVLEKPGVYEEKKYRVGKQNTNFNTIEVYEQKDDGTWEEPKTFSLSKNFTEMDMGHGVVAKYVDSKLSP